MDRFKTGLGKLYNGDCIEYLKQTYDHIDAIITDPPYGVNIDYGLPDYDDSLYKWKMLMLNWLPLALSKSRTVVFPGGFDQEVFLLRAPIIVHGKTVRPKWRICWYKGAQSQRSPIGFKHFELLFVYGEPKCQTPDFFFANPGKVDKRINHPVPKPLAFYEWLISAFTKEGDVVCDPFSGSGQFALVCEKLGRKWIGVEKNPEFYKSSINRLKVFNTFDSLFDF